MLLDRSTLLLFLALVAGCGDGGETPAHPQTAELGPAGPQEPSEEARGALARARELFQAGGGPAALAEARRAVQLAPGWLDARLQLGKVALILSTVKFGTSTREQTLWHEAVEQFEQAHRLAPSNADVSYWWGHALFIDQRFAESVPHYEHALGIDPKHKLAAKELGLAHAAEGHVAEARQALERARELLPNDDEVLFQLGLQLENQDDVKGAIDVFLDAVRLNPAHPGPRTRLVSLYQRIGAEDAAKKAAEDLARCKEFARRLSQATQKAEQNPRDAAAFVEVGRVYLELGMLDPARSWAERALRIDAQNAGALKLKEKLEEKQKEEELAPTEEEVRQLWWIAPGEDGAQRDDRQ